MPHYLTRSSRLLHGLPEAARGRLTADGGPKAHNGDVVRRDRPHSSPARRQCLARSPPRRILIAPASLSVRDVSTALYAPLYAFSLVGEAGRAQGGEQGGGRRW